MLDKPLKEYNWGLSGIFLPSGQRENCWEETFQKMTSSTSRLPLPPPPSLRSPPQRSHGPRAARASRLCCWGGAAGAICLRGSQLWKDFDSNPAPMSAPWVITWLWKFWRLQHLCAARTWYGGGEMQHLPTWSSPPPPPHHPLLSFSSPPTRHVPGPWPPPARPADALLPAVASTPPPWPPSLRQTARKRETRLRFLSGLREVKNADWWRVPDEISQSDQNPPGYPSVSLMRQKKFKESCGWRCHFLRFRIYPPVIVFKISSC